ncbi:MAG: pyridine nucleotide-disulfide oxidoreductase, partial [Pseudomonadota bacterium]
RRHGLRYACCGDAAGFLDPVFSSGVFLACTSAERIAERVHKALLEGREADPELHADDDKDYRLGFRTMQLIVERFYQSDLVHNLFFEAHRDPEIKNEIARILAGDLWSDDNLFQQSLLQSRRRK